MQANSTSCCNKTTSKGLISLYKVQSTIHMHFAKVQTCTVFQHMLRPLWTLERVSCLSDATDAAKPHYLIKIIAIHGACDTHSVWDQSYTHEDIHLFYNNKISMQCICIIRVSVLSHHAPFGFVIKLKKVWI